MTLRLHEFLTGLNLFSCFSVLKDEFYFEFYATISCWRDGSVGVSIWLEFQGFTVVEAH
jgi:hypothetical protein